MATHLVQLILGTRSLVCFSKTEFKGLFKKIPQNVDWSELSKYEQQDYTVASQELACSADGCEIVDL